MAERLRTAAARQPGRTLGVLAAIAVLGSALAAGWTERLALSGSDARTPALVIELRGDTPARSAAFRVAVRTMRAQLSADPAVDSVRERRVPGHPRESRLVVDIAPGGRDRDLAVERIQGNLDPGQLRTSFSGRTASLRNAREETVDDLVLLLLAAPLVALLLVAILGLRRAGATAVAAAAAAALAALACELLGPLVDLSQLALVGAAAGGALVSVQLCAAAAAGAGAATVGLGAAAAAAVFGSAGLLGVGYLAAIGVGGALGAIFAAPAALAAAAAATALERNRDAGAAVGARGGGAWARLAGLITWKRVVATAIAVLAAALLLVGAVAATRLQPTALAAAPPVLETAELAAACAAALLATALAAWFASRRPVLSAAVALCAGLPALAVAGLIVLVFQDGRLETLLDYSSTGGVHLGSAVAALACISALAAAQAVTLGAAARTRPAQSPGGTEAGRAMARCGPAATAACVSGAAAGAALAASSLPYVKQFGAALAAGLVLELLLVQALLVPGLLGVLARRRAAE